MAIAGIRRGRPLAFETLESRKLLAVSVASHVETQAFGGEEDDIAIWIHPTDTSQSKVIGTVKTSSSSLVVYNLAGQAVQTVAVSNVNNVDLRYNFLLSGQPTAILAGSNRNSNSISLYRIDSQTGLLTNVAARTISTGIDIYGCAMYVSPTTGKYFVFVSSESGVVQQWELRDAGGGKVDATQVRSFFVGSQVEGIVADDELGVLYVGEENVGIWKYSAEPGGGSSRTRVDTTGSGGNVSADVEGLAIYYAAGGKGYLLASSQGSNDFSVYRREGNNAYLGDFKLVSSGGIDAVSDTDGIDVTNFPLGSQFPQGMFVAQDNNDNFKFVRWNAITSAFGGTLSIDTSWDPRVVGKVNLPLTLSGDYNLDGRVNAADYTIWRDTLGKAVAEYDGADGDGDRQVDPGDYTVWKANFGKANGAAARGEDAVEATSVQNGYFAATWAEISSPATKTLHRDTKWIAYARSQDAALLAWLSESSRDSRRADRRVASAANSSNVDELHDDAACMPSVDNLKLRSLR